MKAIAYFPSGHVIEVAVYMSNTKPYISVPYYGRMGKLFLCEHPEIKIDLLGERSLDNTESML